MLQDDHEDEEIDFRRAGVRHPAFAQIVGPGECKRLQVPQQVVTIVYHCVFALEHRRL